jgi:mono/diheme cytochrome c family protein
VPLHPKLRPIPPSLSRRAASCALVPALIVGVAVVLAPRVPANPPPDDAALLLLEQHCAKCHGGEKTQGGLDLITRESLLRGGESGQNVVPGKPDESLLVQVLRHQKDPHMPRKAAKLPERDIETIAAWVKAGATYSRSLNKTVSAGGKEVAHAEFTVTDTDRQHWAFQPVKRVEPPEIDTEGPAITHPIDRFIMAKLEEAGLQPSPPASRETLIRRVTFDLIGLPPTPQESDAFVNDTSPRAYEALIDRLLDSPHYGERWGRHWLDLARFAETDGFEHDAIRPHSWRYRDYVIKAFNDDKPYDRFIREQIAGDELWPDSPEALTATAFNLLGPDMVDSSDQVQRRHNTLNDMTDTASLTFLGLTMGCARCHDHKFEPISQKDYYSLQAFFTPVKFDRAKPIPTPEALAAFEEGMRRYNDHAKVKELAALEAPVRERIYQKKLEKLSPEAQVAHRTPEDQRNAEQENLVLETLSKVQVRENDLANALDPETKQWRKFLLDDVKKVPRPSPLPATMALAPGRDPEAKTHVLNRGEYSQPTDEVNPGFPAVLGAKDSVPIPASSRQRIALAEWIASPSNPLTARVMVNRIWQHHFGRGLVATPSEFGTHGQKPTHPELLDWLASEFIARGWSLKAMHRLMLTSATYKQGSAGSGNPQSAIRNPQSTDPENRLLSRMNRLRIEGEVIRDSLLVIGDKLNPELGGPGVFPPIPKELYEGSMGGWNPNDHEREYSRRSVYIFARRNLRFPFLEVFDAPDSNLSCPLREKSTTAPQSLALLNADEVLKASQAAAARFMREAANDEDRITLACRYVLGRPPSPDERAMARNFLKQSPLSEFCRALFNLNDFVYLD